MRGYFDSEELDGEEPREPGHERRRDTELTLGWGALVGSVFGLILVCGLSFWLGYVGASRFGEDAGDGSAACRANGSSRPGAAAGKRIDSQALSRRAGARAASFAGK